MSISALAPPTTRFVCDPQQDQQSHSDRHETAAIDQQPSDGDIHVKQPVQHIFLPLSLCISTARRAATVRHQTFPVCPAASVRHLQATTPAPGAASVRMSATGLSHESPVHKATLTAGGEITSGVTPCSRDQRLFDQALPSVTAIALRSLALFKPAGGVSL